MVGAYCYAELGCMIRESGGDYTYYFRALGSLPAFLRLWIEIIISRPGSYAVAGLTFAKYLVYLIFPDCEPPKHVERMLAALCIREYFRVTLIPILQCHDWDSLSFDKRKVNWRTINC